MAEEQPKTARGIMMESFAERQEEAEKRSVVYAAARRALDEHFKPEEVHDMRDAQRMAHRAAEMAAYHAIEMYMAKFSGDMQMIRQFVDDRLKLAQMEPPKPFVVPKHGPASEA